MRFEFTLSELENLKNFARGRGNSYDDEDELLFKKLLNYISKLEAFMEGEK